MRGKPREHPPLDDHIGITPAYAGKTFGLSSNASGSWDHPRVCGENTPRDYGQKIQIGSPPRMRGKREDVSNLRKETGITPAYAGKTCQILQRGGLRTDHPRVCGENLWIPRKAAGQAGSPPRMRGKRCRPLRPRIYRRITPAYAGKTLAKGNTYQPLQDHPRVCGENEDLVLTQRRIGGSPPRMRGKLQPSAATVQPARITPAYAGKTI